MKQGGMTMSGITHVRNNSRKNPSSYFTFLHAFAHPCLSKIHLIYSFIHLNAEYILYLKEGNESGDSSLQSRLAINIDPFYSRTRETRLLAVRLWIQLGELRTKTIQLCARGHAIRRKSSSAKIKKKRCEGIVIITRLSSPPGDAAAR